MNINLTLIAQAVSFAVFIWFTVKFIWPPLLSAIEQRQKQIADGLAAAEEGKQALAVSAKQADAEIAKARNRAAEIVAQAETRSTQMIEEAKLAAHEAGGRELAAAKAEIEQETSRAREALRDQVAALVVAGAEQILRREVNAQAHADLLAQLKQDLRYNVMAEVATIARPYAEAAFGLADAAGTLPHWSAALERLAEATTSPEVHQLLGDPKVSARQLTDILLAVAGDSGAELRNFVAAIVESKRVPALKAVRDIFETLKNEREGTVDAMIESAFPLDGAPLASLVGDLERRFGRRIRAEVLVNRDLIGGVKVVVGDEVIDGSVRGKLAAMATALKN